MVENVIDKALDLLRNTDDTPYKIAKSTGLSQSIIGKWKKGESKPTMANARHLLQYFSEPPTAAHNEAFYQTIISSQQETIRNLSETIKNLTSKNQK